MSRHDLTGRPRVYPELRVGDRFGDRVVFRILPRGHRGRSDERVEWLCACGKSGETYAFNLRDRVFLCSHRGGVARELAARDAVRLVAFGSSPAHVEALGVRPRRTLCGLPIGQPRRPARDGRPVCRSCERTLASLPVARRETAAGDGAEPSPAGAPAASPTPAPAHRRAQNPITTEESCRS